MKTLFKTIIYMGMYFLLWWFTLYAIEFTDAHEWQHTDEMYLATFYNAVDIFWGFGMLVLIMTAFVWPIFLLAYGSSNTTVKTEVLSLSTGGKNSNQIQPRNSN